MDRFDRFKKPGGGGGGGGGFSRQAAVKALKESVQTGHKTGLPPALLSLFTPRPNMPAPPEIKKPVIRQRYTGVAAFTKDFASEGDPEYQPPPAVARPPSPRLFRNREFAFQVRLDTETKTEKKLRLSKWKTEEGERELQERCKAYDPNKDPKIEGDPYKTIIVSRLSYDVTEKKLRREFEEYGPIKRVRIVTDKAGKPRGYAFVEFEHKADMKEAYKAADGRKIEGRRVLVDVERGRTVEAWKPRRLGGGLGAPGREPKAPKKARPGAAPLPLPAPAPADDRRGGGGGFDRDRSPPRRPADAGRGGYDPRGGAPGGGGGYERGGYREPPRSGDFRGGGGGDRDRKREREPSPRRDYRDDRARDRPADRDRPSDRDRSDRDRGGDDKRPRRDLEDGELRDDRGGGGGGGSGRDRERRRERDMV